MSQVGTLTDKEREITPPHSGEVGAGKLGNGPSAHEGKGQRIKEKECFKIILPSKNSAQLGLADAEGSRFMAAPICFSGTVRLRLLWL